MYELEFITEENLLKHVKKTLEEYGDVLKKIDLKKFNSNLIDPIKLLFDSKVYQKEYKDIIKDEIFRQRDKSNSNLIGYFHQNIFQYIENCTVPKEGFDIIFKDGNQTIYVEMKNKHNTMNSSSAGKTMMRMQSKILDEPMSKCYLVEVIAKKSQDIPWQVTVDKEKIKDERIRRVSIDKFWEYTTGDEKAFHKLCNTLPDIIDKLIDKNDKYKVAKDTAYEELLDIDPDILKALFYISFGTYNGFNK